MDNEKRARLETHGWRHGSTTEFLELTSEDAASVEGKLAKKRASRKAQHSRIASEKGLARSKKDGNH